MSFTLPYSKRHSQNVGFFSRNVMKYKFPDEVFKKILWAYPILNLETKSCKIYPANMITKGTDAPNVDCYKLMRRGKKYIFLNNREVRVRHFNSNIWHLFDRLRTKNIFQGMQLDQREKRMPHIYWWPWYVQGCHMWLGIRETFFQWQQMRACEMAWMARVEKGPRFLRL